MHASALLQIPAHHGGDGGGRVDCQTARGWSNGTHGPGSFAGERQGRWWRWWWWCWLAAMAAAAPDKGVEEEDEGDQDQGSAA